MELTRSAVAALFFVACSSSSSPTKPSAATVEDAAATVTSPDATAAPPSPETIGVAKMETDGTIVMDLRATGPGMIGDARIVYRKDHKDYQMIIDHLGGLAPGETKPVPPFPSP